MAIRNINPELGDNVIFESVEEMEQAIRELESKNGGEWMPEDGLKEGRDYEALPVADTVRIAGRMDNAFSSISAAKADYIAKTEETPTAEDEVALNVYETPVGRYYLVSVPGDGTNCSWESLDNADDWFQDAWIESCEEPFYQDAEEVWYIARQEPKQISIDNGLHLVPAGYLTDDNLDEHWDALVAAMDDETRERVHRELAPCSNREFLIRYLELAPCDLVIG